MVVVSCRLAIEKNDTLNIEFHLQECLFNDNWFKHSYIYNGSKIIKN